VLIHHEKELHRVLRSYVAFFNRAQPHQGIHQQVPEGEFPSVPPGRSEDCIKAIPVLGGYTTSTEVWPERFERQAILPEEIEFRIP
jgi:hypothetical protein